MLVPDGHVECLIKRTQRDEAVEGSWTAGGTRELQRARADVETHEICSEDRAIAHELLDEIGFQPKGLTPRQPITLAQARTSQLRDALSTVAPAIPRAWDPSDPQQHYAALYPGIDRASLVEHMRMALRAARDPYIPPYMQDVLYKILVSGHLIGPRKEHKLPDDRLAGAHVCPLFDS